MIEWTPIQTKILAVLNDGKLHSNKELHACLEDELAPMANLYPHLTAINEKLELIEQKVICDRSQINGTRYRRVRLVHFSE